MLALLGARACLSSAAASDLEPLTVEVIAPSSCPVTPRVFERVRMHTSRVREARAGETARLLRVSVTSHAGGFVADLELREQSDELRRRVPGKTCDEVLAAVALIVALAIDTNREDAGASPPDGDAPEASDVPETATVKRQPSRAPPGNPAVDAGAGRTTGARWVASLGTAAG